MRPDLILHNASIATCDPHDSSASALAVWRGRIAAVGGDSDVLPLAGPGTRVVDLGGRFVCPGFTDCHVHLTSWAMVASGRRVNLEGAHSLAEALERIGAAAKRLPPTAWLQGRGWDKNEWEDNRFPTAKDLDRVVGDLPVALASHDGHSLWVNTAAMRVAGIEPHMPDPKGGRILREPDGSPSGVFQEAAAAPIWEVVPEPGVDDLAAALREALPQAAALGLTGAHNCEGPDSLRALQVLRDWGELTLRVVQYLPADALHQVNEVGLRSGFGDEWVRFGGLKAFADGALGSQTAAMLEPYEGSDNRGVLTMTEVELEELVLGATEAGLALALHAIGDHAVRLALDAYEKARGCCPGPWPRHRIEHAQHVHPDDVPRMAALGIVASVQPAHLLADINTCERHLGRRCRWAFPFRSLADGGVCLALGSDAPVETLDPLVGLRSALLRQRRDGTPREGWYPEQKLTPRQALRGYTVEAARASGEENQKGSLEVGKVADFVVLSANPLAVPPEDLEDLRVLATVLSGECIHDAEGLLG